MYVVTELAGDIETLIENDELRPALEKMRLLSIDYSPNYRNEITLLFSRLNRHESERRTSRQSTENINDITHATLELLTKIVATAETPETSFATRISTDEIRAGLNNLPKVNSDTIEFRREIIRDIAAKASPSQRIETVVLNSAEHYFGTGAFVLGPLNLTLNPGEITVVFGNNGSGKTTLLRVVAGALALTGGSITYPRFGSAADWPSIKSQISFISPKHMRSELSVRHTLEYIATAFGKLGNANRDAIDDFLARYDLERYSHYGWSELSDGYLMRAELIRALICNPKLLILDEPLANLDLPTRNTFLSELIELTSTFTNPTSILLSTHHVEEAEFIADQLIVLENGKSKFCGSRKQLRDLMGGSTFRIRGDFSDFASQIAKLDGLLKMTPTLGGAELAFSSVMTINDLLDHFTEINFRKFSSVEDISDSVRRLLLLSRASGDD